MVGGARHREGDEEGWGVAGAPVCPALWHNNGHQEQEHRRDGSEWGGGEGVDGSGET